MTRRVPASMRTRETLSALIEGRLSSPDGRSELVRLATRLILEEALEAETRDALGRDYYERGAEEGRGWRNGHRTGRLKTGECQELCVLGTGPFPRDRPQPPSGLKRSSNMMAN